jgi:hypothetical protein
MKNTEHSHWENNNGGQLVRHCETCFSSDVKDDPAFDF